MQPETFYSHRIKVRYLHVFVKEKLLDKFLKLKIQKRTFTCNSNKKNIFSTSLFFFFSQTLFMQSFILITKPINKLTVKVVFYAADKVSVFYCPKICVDIKYMDV